MYKALEVEFSKIMVGKSANYASNNGMYIKRDNACENWKDSFGFA